MKEEKKVAIMQPYFLPYIGYWQLMNAVDVFVIYDDIEFTKSGWIHRNRYLSNGNARLLSLPLKKAPDHLDIIDRRIADSFPEDREKMIRQIEGAYKKSPYFDEVYHLFKSCMILGEDNLFNFVKNSIDLMKDFLGIKTTIVVSSKIMHKNNLKRQDRVIHTCKQLNASHYINLIGGANLYSKEEFNKNQIDLYFHESNKIKYKQFENEFVPFLSIIDVLMFNGLCKTKEMLNEMILK